MTESSSFWHGGGRITGDMILPSHVTGVSRSGDVGVHVTTARSLAETYAATVDEPTAWLYQVEPVGPLQPMPSSVGGPTISYRCDAARILSRYTLANVRRREIRAVVARVNRLLP
jgi:hypothetical protein